MNFDGVVFWREELRSQASRPVILDSTVIVTDRDGWIYALPVITGSPRRETRVAEPRTESLQGGGSRTHYPLGRPYVYESRVFVGVWDGLSGELVAFDSDLEEHWRLPLESRPPGFGASDSFAGFGESIYLGLSVDTFDETAALYRILLPAD